jgi:phosphoglycerate dehydrogenase-like enzyme
MKIIGYDLYVKESPLPGIIEMYDELDDMLPHADFVSLHIPFDPHIGPTIGADELAKMKKGSFLINCARGGTVDEHALYDALNSGHLTGAGLDVFEQEPPQFQELLDHPLTTLTPHIGASTTEGQERVGIEVAKVMMEALGG